MRASASELRQELPEELRDELQEDLDDAVKWRDRLAHRYLREQMHGSETSLFKPGTLSQLERLASDFSRFGDRLREEHERLTADWPRGENMPAAQQAALRDIGALIFRNEPLRSAVKTVDPHPGHDRFGALSDAAPECR